MEVPERPVCNFVRRVKRASVPLFCLVAFTWLNLLIEAPALGAGLTVGASESIQLGMPGVETNLVFDFINIQAGGKVEIFGNVKIAVISNVVVDGLIFSLPTGKLPPGDSGIDGEDAGASGAVNGTLGSNGPDWFIASSSLTINSLANVFINGSLLFSSKLDGGDGGPGGHGGNGAPGTFSLGNAGGWGGRGGLPGLVGSLFIAAKNRLELGPDSIISLDNLGVGGTGGPGGDGGDGGDGPNGVGLAYGGKGGNGGPIGNGGDGGDSRAGGNLTLRADTLSLQGVISSTGNPGSKGGAAGHPSSGGKGGNAGPDAPHPPNPPPTGGDGGNAGNGSAGFGYNTDGSGNGGPGGNGGTVTLDARVLMDEGIIDVSGGPGGKGGDGWEAGAGLGGLGGSPGGKNGLDSPEIPPGKNGANGLPGSILVPNPWVGVPGSRVVFPAFLNTSHNGSFGPAPGSGDGSTTYSISAGSSAPFRIAATVNTGNGGAEMLEFVLKYRWVSPTGSLDVTLAGTNLVHLEAAASASDALSEVHVFVTAPSVLNRYNQNLVLQLNPLPSAKIEIADFSLLSGTDEMRIGRSAVNAGQIDLSWFGFTNKTYQLQAQSLTSGSQWKSIGATVSGKSALISTSQNILPPPAQQFYRLSISSP